MVAANAATMVTRVDIKLVRSALSRATRQQLCNSTRSATDLCLSPFGALPSNVDVETFSKPEPEDAPAASAT